MNHSRLRHTACVASLLATGFAGAACSNSDAPNQIERIDGPAQVDPDFEGLDDGTVVVVEDGSNESESGG